MQRLEAEAAGEAARGAVGVRRGVEVDRPREVGVGAGLVEQEVVGSAAEEGVRQEVVGDIEILKTQREGRHCDTSVGSGRGTVRFRIGCYEPVYDGAKGVEKLHGLGV